MDDSTGTIASRLVAIAGSEHAIAFLSISLVLMVFLLIVGISAPPLSARRRRRRICSQLAGIRNVMAGLEGDATNQLDRLQRELDSLSGDQG